MKLSRIAFVASLGATFGVTAHAMGISADLGSTGVGAHLSIPLQKNLNARFGVNMLNYDYSSSTSDLNYDLKLKLQTFDALLDWFPMKDSGFRLSGGLVYNNNRIDAVGKANGGGTYTLQGHTYGAATVGTINGRIDFRKLAPYLGIGWGATPSKPSGGWSLQADLGVLFQGSPDTSLSNSGCTASAAVCGQLAQDLVAENNDLRDKSGNFRAYPVLRIGVGYAF